MDKEEKQVRSFHDSEETQEPTQMETAIQVQEKVPAQEVDEAPREEETKAHNDNTYNRRVKYHEMVTAALQSVGGRADLTQICDYIRNHYWRELTETTRDRLIERRVHTCVSPNFSKVKTRIGSLMWFLVEKEEEQTSETARGSGRKRDRGKERGGLTRR